MQLVDRGNARHWQSSTMRPLHFCIIGCALSSASAVLRAGASGFIRPEDYGAIGDGIADDTQALREASAALQDGQTLLFSSEMTYLTGPWNITRKTDISILVQSGSTVQALGMDRWPESGCLPNNRGPERTIAEHACSPFIRIAEVDGLKISGGGTVDGAGKLWWEEHDHVRCFALLCFALLRSALLGSGLAWLPCWRNQLIYRTWDAEPPASEGGEDLPSTSF